MMSLLGRMDQEEVKWALSQFNSWGYDVLGRRTQVRLEIGQRTVTVEGRKLYLTGDPVTTAGLYTLHHHDIDDKAYLENGIL